METAVQVDGSAPKTLVVALAGPPNVGKSTVFNLLTGLSQHVGNWPGKTVEQKTGTHRRNGRVIKIVDLPGTYSLTANSLEERVARDYVLKDRPDVVVVVLNAANLERNLYLVAELMELPTPVVIGLNMVDVAKGQGMRVEAEVLEAALRVPVIPLIATHGQGLHELLDAVEKACEDSSGHAPRRPELGSVLEALIDRTEKLIQEEAPEPYPTRWLALKLLEGDREVTALLGDVLSDRKWQELQRLLHQNEDAVVPIASARYEWIERMVRAALTRPQTGVVSVTERLDRLATHMYVGPAILVALLGLILWFVYEVAESFIERLEGGLEGLGEFLQAALANVNPWLVGLLVDGVLAGVGAVLTLLPILVVFFLLMGILEDVGYMARAAFVADRFMHHMGLHGKSFLPLFIGFGCNVPAVLGTRILESPRSRLLTIFIAPLVPCAGRVAVLIFITGAVFGRSAPLIILSLVAFSLIVLSLSGALLNRVLFRGESPAFIMELPLYHWPNWRTIGLTVWQRLVAFVARAGTVILVVSVIVWALAALPNGEIDSSYLARAGQFLEPVGRLMGMDWRMMVALITSFVAKENTIATLAILTAAEEATLAVSLSQILTPAAALAFLAVQMLFIPCIATVAAIRQETGNWRWTAFSLIYLLAISLIAGIAIYQIAVIARVGL